MDRELIRAQSLKTAKGLGYPVNEALPLMDDVHTSRSVSEIIERLLCLHAAAACAYGFDRSTARAWLDKELLLSHATAAERQFIEHGNGDPNRFRVQVEAMWALAWALGVVTHIEFSKKCSDSFAVMLPNLKVNETSSALRSKVRLRTIEELFEACDLAYCLHWAIRQAHLTGGKLPGNVPAFVVEERRRALEWLLDSDPWDAVSLDT